MCVLAKYPALKAGLFLLEVAAQFSPTTAHVRQRTCAAGDVGREGDERNINKIKKKCRNMKRALHQTITPICFSPAKRRSVLCVMRSDTLIRGRETERERGEDEGEQRRKGDGWGERLERASGDHVSSDQEAEKVQGTS